MVGVHSGQPSFAGFRLSGGRMSIEWAHIIIGTSGDPVEVRVLARADGYVMVRRKGCIPVVVTERELDLGAAVFAAVSMTREGE